MKNNIKIISVLMSLVMILSVFSIVPVSISATETKTTLTGYNDDPTEPMTEPPTEVYCDHWYTYSQNENYQYYDDGCSYDIVTYCYDCGREVYREHKEVQYPTGDKVIYFDNSVTNWYGPVQFYIYDPETGYAVYRDWGSKYLNGTDIGNNIWAKDLSDYDLDPGKQYCIIFSDTSSYDQTYDLLIDNSCYGDTAYYTGNTFENPVDSMKFCKEAKWTNSSLGSRKQITSIGNVVGETIPDYTTGYDMFIHFLNDLLDNARWYSRKDDQTLIDDTAIELGLSKIDVMRAINESGRGVYWDYNRSNLPLPQPVEIPDEDGLILFDAASIGWQDSSAIMFDIFDLNDQRLPAESTPDEIRGTKSYDGIWFFNAKERGVEDGQLYYIIFWNDDTGAHTGSLLLDTSCYGDKAYSDGSAASEMYVYYPPYRSRSGASASSSSSSSWSSSSSGAPYLTYPEYVSYSAVSWNDSHSFSWSGTIGDCTWSIENGVLTISGSGSLENDDNTKKIWNRFNFTDAVIQNGVTSIGESVFEGCYSLKHVTIGNSVKSIGQRAFKDCKNLESISIGNGVTSIGQYAFYRCVGLKTAVIGNAVTSIGSAAFCYCGSLESVTLGNALTKIDKYTFAECTVLKTVNIGSSVYGIAQGAFSGCENLEEVTLPDSVQIIADSAFSHCTALTNVNIPDSVTDIGEFTFYECPNLKRVTIPASVTNINAKAFGYYRNDEFGITMKVPGFTIYGDVNSDAQSYAKAYGFAFERAIVMTGDADGDYQVTVMDVSEIQHSLASMNTKTDDDLTKYADVDKNEVLEIIDATWILRYTAGIETPYDAAIGQITSNH